MLSAAIERLESALGPLRIGGLYRTLPRSPIPQPPYLNTAVVGHTRWPPAELLRLAKELEAAAGRRPGPRLGPRELDIDLLLYGCEVSEQPDLTLPHSGLRSRRFALAPLADVAPLAPVPPDGTTVEQLLAQVGQEEEVEWVAW